MFSGQSKPHHTRTKQWNPSVMFSSLTHNCIPAIVCSQHTRLVTSNHRGCYRSSHTFPITYLFASYHTHLVHLNHFRSHVPMQTIHPSEPYAVYCTRLHLAARFFCSSSSQTVNWTEPCPSSHMQLKPEPCLMHPSSQMFYTFLTVFIHHRLRL